MSRRQYALTLSDANLPSTLRLDLPVLFIWGAADSVAMPSQISRARKYIPRLQDLALEGKGHWVMVEAKNEVTSQVLSWLESLIAKPGPKL
jgi:soluble epoxide hydrolase/lipid-phosphate phosphatase